MIVRYLASASASITAMANKTLCVTVFAFDAVLNPLYNSIINHTSMAIAITPVTKRNAISVGLKFIASGLPSDGFSIELKNPVQLKSIIKKKGILAITTVFKISIALDLVFISFDNRNKNSQNENIQIPLSIADSKKPTAPEKLIDMLPTNLPLKK